MGERKLTICLLSGTWDPTINGVITSVKTFTAGLRDLGANVYTVVPSTKAIIEDPTIIQLPAVPLPASRGDYYLLLVTANQVAAQLRAIEQRAGVRFDILHAQHLFQVSHLTRLVAARLGVPVIATFHTLIEEYAHYVPLLPQVWARQLLKNHGRVALNQMNHVITPSPSIRSLLIRQGVTVPMTAIPTGIQLLDYRQIAADSDLKKLGIDPKRRLILFVGRLAKEKNLDLLLRAYQKIRQVSVGAERPQLVLIGGGPEERAIRQYRSTHQLNDDLILTGMLPPASIKPIFGRAYVFVHPSNTDTQAITIMEAMAAGVPAIALNKFGPGDYIADRQTGLLIDNTPTSLVHALSEILGNKRLRDTLGTNAHQKANEFSVHATSQKLLAVYQETIKTAF